MHDLEITWPEGRKRFTPEDSPVLIGRSSSAAVVVPQGTVSRRHLTVNWTGQSWVTEDTSTHGSFDPIGVRLAPSWTVGTDVNVRLGSPRGVELSLRLITRTLDPVSIADPYADPDSPPTVVDFGPPPPPDPIDGSGGLLHVPDDGPPPLQNGPAHPAPSFAGSGPVEGMLSKARPQPGEPEFRDGSPASAEEAGELAVAEAPDSGPALDLTSAEPQLHLDGPPRSDRVEGGPLLFDTAASQRPAQFDELSRRSDPFGSWQGPDGDASAGRPAETFVENDTLRLQIDGEDLLFLPGHEVTVGRDPTCMVTVDERHSLVSRRHLRFVHNSGAWWLEDTSSKGTYVDGRRLNRPYRAEGAFMAMLGDGAAGTQLRVVTRGEHKQPTNRAGMIVAAVAASALVLAALAAWFVFRTDDGSAEALSTAKRSTVMLLSDTGHGSGFFVSRSMIVTNQHVAAMADQLVVAVSPEEDEPAEIRYVATLVENHPFLDIAVVRLTNRAEINDAGTVTIGDEVDSADVPILQLGDSSVVTIGDAVTSTGFPGRFSVSSSDDSGNTRLAAVTTTGGQAANFTSWPGCSTPDLASFIPANSPPTVTCSADGNIDKGVLLASFPSGEGASGSAVLHEDKVVAVLFAGDDQNSTASRSITTNAFSGWLGTVLAENS